MPSHDRQGFGEFEPREVEVLRFFRIVQLLVGQDRQPRVEDIRANPGGPGKYRVDGRNDSSLATSQLCVSGC